MHRPGGLRRSSLQAASVACACSTLSSGTAWSGWLPGRRATASTSLSWSILALLLAPQAPHHPVRPSLHRHRHLARSAAAPPAGGQGFPGPATHGAPGPAAAPAPAPAPAALPAPPAPTACPKACEAPNISATVKADIIMFSTINSCWVRDNRGQGTTIAGHTRDGSGSDPHFRVERTVAWPNRHSVPFAGLARLSVRYRCSRGCVAFGHQSSRGAPGRFNSTGSSLVPGRTRLFAPSTLRATHPGGRPIEGTSARVAGHHQPCQRRMVEEPTA